MDRKIRHCLAAAVVLGWAAMPGRVRADCSLSDLMSDDTRAAAVASGAPRTHFVQEGDPLHPCKDGGPSCEAPAYVVPGDIVLIGPAEGMRTNVSFLSIYRRKG